MELKKIANYLGLASLYDNGGIADDSTQNQAAIAALIAEVPATGGIAYIKPSASAYRLGATVTIADRKGIVLDGGGQGYVDATNNESYSSLLRVIGGWGATTPMFLISGSGSAVQNAKGGHLFRGLALHAGLSGEGTGGYGFHITKPSATSDFWGNLTWDGGWIFNANIGLFFDDSVGNGFGFISVGNRQRIQACNYGIYSNADITDLRVINALLRQNKQSSNSSYLTRSGGAVVLTKASNGVTLIGSIFEGSQVAAHLTGTTTGLGGKHIGFTMLGNYCEATHDGLAILTGNDDATIIGNFTDNGAQRQKHIYVQNCNRITQERNNQSFFIVAPHCRDLVTDTPKLTRFTVTTAGSQTLEDYGTWTHSVPPKQPCVRPVKQAHFPMESIVLSNMTLSAYSGIGPFGGSGKALVAQASSATSYVQLGWDTTQISATLGQFIVLSVRLYYPTTNNPSTGSGSWTVREDINGGGWAYKSSNAITRRTVNLGEWVTWQWVHKVVAADISAGVCLYRVRVELSDADGANDPFVIGGATVTVGDTPAVDPMDSVISCEADGTELQYYMHNGDGVFYGAAEPTGSLITWNDSEQVVFNNAIAAGNIGTACTTAGTGGGTAVFKAFGVIAA